MAVAVGERAPDFTLQNQHGESISLSDFAGQKNVLLVFYPWAFSRVCTGELQQLRDKLVGSWLDATELLAVSCDPMFSLRAYADQDGYAFSLLSDFWPHGEVATLYGVFNAHHGHAERLTVVIDREAVIRWTVENDMSSARSLEDYRTVLSTLR